MITIRKSFLKKSLIILMAMMMAVPLLGLTAFAAGETGTNVTLYGANGKDNIDDTDAIQKALSLNDSVYIPDGTYMIDADKSLNLKSNQTLKLSDGAVLQALPSSNESYNVIRIANVSNVIVDGGRIVGERYSHTGTGGEWGMGVNVNNGATNIVITNMTISDCWGDGLYLGGPVAVKRVQIDNVISENNRRQGLSITNALDVTISNSIFRNTNGTAPEAGIDIEPNDGQTTSNITINNVQCYGNAGAGLDVVGWMEKIQGVAVSNSSFNDNQAAGIRIVNAKDLDFSHCVSSKNSTGIDIPRDTENASFTNISVSDNRLRGVSLVSANQIEGISNIIFGDSVFSNNSQASANSTDGVRVDNWDSTGYIKNVKFNNCKFLDNQKEKTQRYGLTVGFSKNMYEITISNCNFNGNITGDYLGGKSMRML